MCVEGLTAVACKIQPTALGLASGKTLESLRYKIRLERQFDANLSCFVGSEQQTIKLKEREHKIIFPPKSGEEGAAETIKPSW